MATARNLQVRTTVTLFIQKPKFLCGMYEEHTHSFLVFLIQMKKKQLYGDKDTFVPL